MEVFGFPISEVLLVTLGITVAAQVAWIAVLLYKLRNAKKNCQATIGVMKKLADENNWGEITVMSSRSDGAQKYKTWIGDGDPQETAKKLSS